MKLSKGMIAVAGVALSGAAYAQDAQVATEKKAPLQQLLPGSYASVELRHATNELYDVETDNSDISPYLDARPTLGSTFYDGKLDTAFTWIFRKTPESARIQKHPVGFYNETTFTVFENDNFKFFPYLYVEQGSTGDSFALADIGPHLDVKQVLKTGAGDVTFSAFFEPLAEFTSGATAAKQKVKNSTDEGYTLAEGETAEAELEQKDPSLLNTTEVAVKFAPAMVKGLSLTLAADYLQNWTPKYKDSEQTGEIDAELDGYATKDAVLNKLSISYKLNDAFTLSNSARYAVGGAYEETYDRNLGVSGLAARFENRLVLTATLF
jgi:hypothetical protein